MSNQINYDEVRRRVEEGLKAEKHKSRVGFFVGNLVMFLTFMAICWIVALSNPVFSDAIKGNDSPFPVILILPTIGWGFGIFFHLMTLLVERGNMERNLREKVIMREMGNEIMQEYRQQYGEKPKNRVKEPDEQPITISDEGE